MKIDNHDEKLSNKIPLKAKKQAVLMLAFLFSDLDRIQTCNLLSRNQMRYSVAPRGLIKGCKYITFIKKQPNYLFQNSK